MTGETIDAFRGATYEVAEAIARAGRANRDGELDPGLTRWPDDADPGAAPPLPPGVAPAVLWGTAERLHELFDAAANRDQAERGDRAADR